MRENLPPVEIYRPVPLREYRPPRVEVSTRGGVRVDGKVKTPAKHGKKMRLMVDGTYIDVAELLRRTCGVPQCPSGVWPGPPEWEVWLPVSRSAYGDDWC